MTNGVAAACHHDEPLYGVMRLFLEGEQLKQKWKHSFREANAYNTCFFKPTTFDGLTTASSVMATTDNREDRGFSPSLG